jgi:hypothetical protein
VDYALAGRPVEGADRSEYRLFGVGDPAIFDGLTRFLEVCSGAPDNSAVANAAFLVLPIALDLRLDISQCSTVPSIKNFRAISFRRIILQHTGAFVQHNRGLI